MNKTVKIYCEGSKGSHDFDIIDKIVSDLGVLIEPIGGKKGALAAIQVYEKLAVKSDNYLFFRDRDFDTAVPDSESLTIDKRTYFSYRTTIENYLFDSDVFFGFMQKENLLDKYPIKINNSKEVKEKVFIPSARRIAYYQALRHTMGKMRMPLDFGTTWIEKGSGTLPTEDELNDTKECRQLALNKVNQSKDKTLQWTEAYFDEILYEFWGKFQTDEFYSEELYLVWFQGKDFAASILSLLPTFPMKRYFAYAKAEFDYARFADLRQLRKILEGFC